MPSDAVKDKWISPVVRAFQHKQAFQQQQAFRRCYVNASVYGVEHKLHDGQLGLHDRLNMLIRVMSVRIQVLSSRGGCCSHHIRL